MLMNYRPSQKIKRTIAVGAMAALTAFASTASFGAGFQLAEQSITGLGRAYAGAGIVGDDLSALMFNPAGITLAPGFNMQLGITVVNLDLDYEGKSGFSENARDKPAPIPMLLMTGQLTDHLWVGLGITSPYGLKIRYDEGWEGRDRGESGSILTLDINPTIAWKFNDYVSLGVGVSALYQHSKIKYGFGGTIYGLIPYSGVFEYKGREWMWTWDIGLMVSPLETLRFGVSYRSAAHVKAKGDYTMRGSLLNYSLDETTYGYGTLTSPETIYLAATWEATQKLRLSFTARWANWKNFENMRFYVADKSGLPYFSMLESLLGTSTTSVSITNDWRATWFFSLGADYKFSDHWTGRLGIGYETNPIKNEKLRTAIIPDVQRLFLALGASWSSGKHWQIDAAIADLVGLGTKKLYNSNEQYIGKFNRLNSFLFGADVQYHF